MSEQRSKYSASPPTTLEAFRNRDCSREYTDPKFVWPTPEEIKALRNLAGWSQSDTAKLTGVNFDPKKGSPTVRRWETAIDKRDYRKIPYAAWRLMLLAAGIVIINIDEMPHPELDKPIRKVSMVRDND